MPSKKLRKTLNNTAGPDCTPPNRPCGDRCIPPNWECHTGVNAVGPRGANSAYRSNVIGAAGNFEAAVRDLSLLAKPGSRRNVFKTMERVQKSTYKGVVELIPYPRLTDKEKAGKSDAEVQAEEQRRYAARVVNTFGLVLGASVVGTLGVFAFRNRRNIDSFIRRTTSDIKFSQEVAESGARFRVARSSPSTLGKGKAAAQNVDNLINAGFEAPGMSLPKRLVLLMTGNMQYSASTIQGFRDAIKRVPAGAVPYYAQGPAGSKAAFIRQQSKGMGLLNTTKGFRNPNERLTTIEKMLSEEAKQAAISAAKLPSSEGIAGFGRLSTEEQAFKDVFDTLTGRGKNNRTLVKNLTATFYSEIAGLRLNRGQTIEQGMKNLYDNMRLDLGRHIRTTLPQVTGKVVKSDSEAWAVYQQLSDAKRQQLLLDYQPSNKAYNRVANSYVAKEWADALSSASDIPGLVARDIRKSEEAVDTLLRRLRRSVFSNTDNPIMDPKAVDFVVGNTDFIDRDFVEVARKKKNLQERLANGLITAEDYNKRMAEMQARPAMNKLLNRIRFENGYSLSLLKKSDLLRALEQSPGFRLPKEFYTKTGKLRTNLKKSDLVEAMEDALRANQADLTLDNITYRRNARRTDSNTFNWGLEGRQIFDAEGENRQGKPCGKSFISRDKDCSRTPTVRSTSTPGTPLAFVAGASLMGMSIGAFALAVANRKKNIPRWAHNVNKMAKDFEVPDSLKVGQRHSQHSKKVKNYSDQFSDAEADSIIFHINGFDGLGYGGDKMMHSHASMIPNAHHVGVSNEEFNVRRDLRKLLDDKVPIPSKLGMLGDNSTDAFRNVLNTSLSEDGNPVAQKLAAQIKAYRDKFPNTPIVVNAWSAGTMVSAEADDLLRKMGITDISYVMYAPFHYGMVPKPPRSTYIGGKYDQLRSVPGFVTKLDYMTNSDHQYTPEVLDKTAKAMRWYLYGRTDAVERLDKKCGKSYISEHEKCEKPPVTKATPVKAIATTTGVAAVGAALANFVKEVMLDTKLTDSEVPPMDPPDGLYDSFKPGDLIYRGTDFAGSKRAHYGVYLGKINDRHVCIHSQEGFGRGKAYLELRSLDLRERPHHTSWQKAKRLSEIEPPPLDEKQVKELIQQLRRKHIRYEVGRMNCENYARAIAGDIPRSTQAEKMGWLSKKIAGFMNDVYADNRTHVDIDYVQKIMKTIRRLDAPMPIAIYLKQLLDAAATVTDPVLAEETIVQGLTNLFLAVLAQEGRLEATADAA